MRVRECAITGAADFAALLTDLTGIYGSLSIAVSDAIDSLVENPGPVSVDELAVCAEFFGRVNQKLGVNRTASATLYEACAKDGVTFNYNAKRKLDWAINTNSIGTLRRELEAAGVAKDVIERTLPCLRTASHEDTRIALANEVKERTKIRKAVARDVIDDVYNAAAGPLVWALWGAEALANAFRITQMSFSGDYMADLRGLQPALFDRQRSLVVRGVRPRMEGRYKEQRDDLTRWIAAEYDALDNYGFLAIVIDTDEFVGTAWRLASDLVLFAERFRETKIAQMFFRWREVGSETREHVGDLDPDATQFDIANEGFTYRDTFVMHAGSNVRRLVVIMQKNRRDEGPIPCPACRTDQVQGNSYPQLGVKSWECCNPVCPDRSIYNRGKRFDFRALLRQEAIEHDDNEIPVESVRRWQRDVVEFVNDNDIIEMLLRHYSMRGDTIALIDVDASRVPPVGRVVAGSAPDADTRPPEGFWASAFFERYVPSAASGDDGTRRRPARDSSPGSDHGWTVVHGRAEHVLQQWPDNSFDRAITSPPYFNARDYSQWPNLYCYLRDMAVVATRVHRVLKPGALYAYNIFDYFDNERIITFSAMGRKRIPLSALMVDIFNRVGFDFVGAVAWDKGEIHGKRGFNAGNNTPFYQAPFNCWEHVLVVQKRGPAATRKRLGVLPHINHVLRIHPVVKMVRGENKHGHTAPFPIELPAALLAGLPANSLVLDPFGGSGTTARAALNGGHEAVIIEAHAGYCELSRRLIADHAMSRP